MKNNNYKEINFFEPKIDINIDDSEFFIRERLLKNSLKIYGLVFCLTMIYFAFNTVKINFKYNSIQNNIEEMTQNNITSQDLKKAIEEQNMLNEVFSNYTETNKVSSSILNEIEKTKFDQIFIGELDWNLDNIKLVCYSQSENDAIMFTEKLRKNENFKDILYTGGTTSSIDGNFKFEINIKI